MTMQFKSRYTHLAVIAATFLFINLAVRLGLGWYDGDSGRFAPIQWAEILLVGLMYDLAALSWLLLPFSLVSWLSGASDWGRKAHALITSAFFLILLAGMNFQAISEFIFWNEFSSRFNFIAVDYLVYTREVVGNIYESYPVDRILTGIGVATLIMAAVLLPLLWKTAAAAAPGFRKRTGIFLVMAALPALFFFALSESPHRNMDDPAARELASNGTYSFFHAFRNNELSYENYYSTIKHGAEQTMMTEELRESHSPQKSLPGETSDVMHRHIPAKGSPIRSNVILVSIESLGSDYIDAFGANKGLTPNLDALAKDSLIFTHLYATGLRTVRGLEALSLSVPPTPGRAVIMRERNKGLQTLGGVLEDNGYESIYFYGGYSFFDNMADFFQGNGYDVIDRNAIPEENITHETIWGVADEDLYREAVQELDIRYARGKPFFAHIMTTSNHRPYTYPEGRVSIPPHTGRDGAVQYTDWAIGDFMKTVRTKPWYENTVFVFVADHTSHGRGRIDLPPENYRIPLIIHAPGLVVPGKFEYIASQIDVAPTLLALLNISYDSHFFGQDILHEAEYHRRAFMANYLTVGYFEDGKVVELAPRGFVRVVDAASGEALPEADPGAKHLALEAIAYYQSASQYIENQASAEDVP